MLNNPFFPLFLSFFLSLNVSAQNIAPVVDWQQCIGGGGNDQAYSMIPTKDGGSIFVGLSYSTDGDVSGTINHGFADIWVVKMSATNLIEWQKQLGGSGYDNAANVVQTSDGGYTILGSTTSNDGDVRGSHVDSTNTSDIWLVKLSMQGDIQWQKCYGGTKHEIAGALIKTTDGGYLITGTTESNDGDVRGNHGYRDGWVVKINALGVIQWQKCYGGASGDEFVCGTQTNNGSYAVSGRTSSVDGDVSGNHGSGDIWVVKLSTSGTIEWQKCYGGSAGEAPNALIATTDGGYIFTGETRSSDGDIRLNHINEMRDAWVVKLSMNGAIEWQRCLGGTKDDVGLSIIQTYDGKYLLAGYTRSIDGDVLSNEGTSLNGWLVKLSAQGNIDWQKVLGGTSLDIFYCVYQTIDEAYSILGVTSSNNGDVPPIHGASDIWLIKLSAGTHAIIGQVNQTNAACQPLTPPQYFPNGQVKIQKSNTTYLVSTDSLGRYGAFVDTGRYTISPVLPNNLWAACPSIETTISTSTRRDTAIVHPSLYVAILCPQMEVQMTTPFLRRCFDNSYTINYANRGTAMQTDATAELTLDTMLTFISATKPVRSRIGNKITFALGNIGVNQAGQFDVVVNVSCNSVLGQTHCSSVLIPKTATCDTVRDTIPTITAQCTITCDSVSFLVKNNGGQTNSTFKYTLIANATALDTGRITLTNTFNLKRKTDGRTYRLELRNINNNQLIAARSIEPPQPPSVSTGFVNQFATINRQINVAENCMANRGAFDPNEKSSVPAGIGTSHLVEQGSLMSYLVQFQNTGTDTAFTVVIRDTLSTLFNLNSLKIQSTSHPATWQLSPNGLLSVRFDNIKLVDSFTNEKKSHGFFTYQIRLKDSIATGTRLENKAAIYFDFNTPIITNYAWHTIGRDFLINCLAKPSINAHFSGCPTKNITFTATSKSSGLTPTYKWFRNSETGPLSINASFTLPNMSNGTKIYCKLTTSSELCTETPMITSDTIVINCINTSTTEITPIQTFDIYPNPNQGVFDVKLSLSKPAMVKLLIVNILGQVLQSNTPTFSTDFFLEKYDISALPNGIYIIKAVVDGQIMMKKVVAQKVF